MKTPINPWAFAPSIQRREPTSTEIANGFPCGPADQQLFNELMYRASLSAREIATVITGEGIALDETKVDQLQQAIARSILRYNGLIFLYVKEDTGLDTNDGLTPATPLKTLNAAITKGQGYRQIDLRLMSNITILSAPLVLNATQLLVYPDTGTRTLTFDANSYTTDSDGQRRVLRFNGTMEAIFNRINIVNNIVEPTVDALIVGTGGHMSFDSLQYAVASAAARPLVKSNNLLGVTMNGITFANTNASDKFLQNVATGVNPNSVWPFRSNLSSM